MTSTIRARRRLAPVIAVTVTSLAVAFSPTAAGAVSPTVAASSDVNVTSTVVSGVDVDASTIPQLESQMNRGKLSSVALVRFYERRIVQLNPKLHAVITVSKTAVTEAAAADRARRHGDRRPLLGIPVLVKDNIDTTGMPTTAGSLALAGSTPPDAFIVMRLKAAGALILGKTNLSEWANYRSTQSSSGWSGVEGQTNMAYVLDRNPCGSSAGSGVAASADLATVAVGTETDGSVVCPSGQNGLVGIKPTLGLASRSGIVPISAQQDTAGPMARNVTDAAVVLGALTGIDKTDPATAAQRGHVTADYTKYLKAGALKGARLGVWRKGTFGVQPGNGRDHGKDHRQIEVPRGSHRRSGQRADRRRLRIGKYSARIRVQTRHRCLPAEEHQSALPEDAGGPDQVRQRPSGAGTEVFRSGDLPRGAGTWIAEGSGLHQGAQQCTVNRPAFDRRHDGQIQARRDHRADQFPGLDHGSDQW